MQLSAATGRALAREVEREPRRAGASCLLQSLFAAPPPATACVHTQQCALAQALTALSLPRASRIDSPQNSALSVPAKRPAWRRGSSREVRRIHMGCCCNQVGTGTPMKCNPRGRGRTNHIPRDFNRCIATGPALEPTADCIWAVQRQGPSSSQQLTWCASCSMGCCSPDSPAPP